jgi:hypothetical protein
MPVAWRERLKRNPELWDIETWGYYDTEALDDEHRALYHRNWDIVTQVLNGRSQVEAGRRHTLSNGRVSQILKRCLGSDEEEDPLLLAGLLYGKNVYESTLLPGGLTGADLRGGSKDFRRLLKLVPNLESDLNRFVESSHKENQQRIPRSSNRFFAEFKRCLEAANWPKEWYPHRHKSLARESVRKLYHELNDRHILQELEKRASKRVHRRKPLARALSLVSVEIDGQQLDAGAGIVLDVNGRKTPVRIARPTLLVARSSGSRAFLAYSLVLKPLRAIDTHDIMRLLRRIHTPWTSTELSTPGLRYNEGAGFPVGLGDDYPIVVDEVSLDNALVHCAKAVREYTLETLNASYHLGFPACPLTRHTVENGFHIAGIRGIHCLPTTTGSHPRDPIRESAKSQSKPTLVTVTALDEILRVIFANFNVEPRPELFWETPLSSIQRAFEHDYVPFVPKALRKDWGGLATQVRKIRQGSTQYSLCINALGVKYTGDALIRAKAEGEVRIRYDDADVRELSAYSTQSGEYFGKLLAPKSWLRYAHSESTRSRLLNMKKEWTDHTTDPVAWYLHNLIERSETLYGAQELLRVQREASPDNTPIVLPAPPPAMPRVDHQWTPGMAYSEGNQS